MKKLWEIIRPYILIFSVHFIVSILFNRATNVDEHIAETIIGSVLFTALYIVLCHGFRKKQQ